MKMTLSQLFTRLESLTSRLNIELDLPDNPAPGTLQEAAKKGGVSGVFGFLAKLVDSKQPESGDPLGEIVNALSGLLKQEAPPLVAQTVQNGSDLLRSAGAKGIEAWTKALAALLPKEDSSSKPSGKDPEVATSADENETPIDSNSQVFTTVAAEASEPSDTETTALTSESSKGYTNSTAIV